MECGVNVNDGELALRAGAVFDSRCVGKGGNSSVENAFICATRFLTDAFLPLEPDVLRGSSSSCFGYKLDSSADQPAEILPLLPLSDRG